ncbi:homeobox and C2H2 transcription factor, partial [Rhexocercosporidium sp. MPI-PUGE-AT-0058]
DWPTNVEKVVPNEQDFLRWVNGAYRPPEPCSYCRYHRLECLIIRTTFSNPNPVAACSSCVALFRECSLAIGEKRKPSEFETNRPIMGHLHGVNEEFEDGLEFVDWGDEADVSAPNTLPEPSLMPGDVSSVVSPAKGKRAISKQDIRVLKAWLSDHRHAPYPSEEEKLELKATTGLTLMQISNWFANARRRQRHVQGIPIPGRGRGSKQKSSSPGAGDLSPISRWQNSPPEDDAVDPSAVARALAAASSTYSEHDGKGTLSRHSSFDNISVSSIDTNRSDLSTSSSNSGWSHSSFASRQSFTRPKRRRRQKRDSIENKTPNTNAFTAHFHCTFCPDSFKKRHDWQRHEKSIHLPLEHWICCSNGSGTFTTPLNGTQCLFCGHPNPTEPHLNAHEHNSCSERPASERAFRRKDHLRQHLVKFHRCNQPLPAVYELWKVEWGELRSRCGFCDEWMVSWEARTEHLATHFKEGAMMSEWTGGWGFEEDVLKLLQNAEVPGMERLGGDAAVGIL